VSTITPADRRRDQQAANTTGTSFEYLLATAKMESNFNPTASASTSSARGLYQFIDQTWLGTVKEAGAQLGYGKYARRHHQIAVRLLFGQRSRRANRDHETARRSRCRFLDGGRADPVQQFPSSPARSAAARPTANSIWRTSWASAARQADLELPRTTRRPPARGCSERPPRRTVRFSSIAAGARAASPRSIRC